MPGGQRPRGAESVAARRAAHVQSNKPRDPTLIPDRADDRCAGRASRSTKSSFRPSTDLKQVGRRSAARGVRARVCDRRAAHARAERARGRRRRFRRTCAIRRATPTCATRRRRQTREWTLDVGPAGASRPDAAATRRSRTIAFGHGETPPARRAGAPPRPARRRGRIRRRRPRASSTASPSLGTTGGYLRQRRVPAIHSQRGNTA